MIISCVESMNAKDIAEDPALGRAQMKNLFTYRQLMLALITFAVLIR